MKTEHDARLAVLMTACETAQRGLNDWTSGNVSLRWGDGLLITPTGVPFEALHAGQIAYIDFAGARLGDGLKASSEWHFHAAIYQARSEVQAVVHTHSMQATAFSCLRKPIPAFHYMVAAIGGKTVPCADYATFGTNALAANVVAALGGHRGCLLANHGVVGVGNRLGAALEAASLIEMLAAQYSQTLALGGPVLLDEAEMERVLVAFQGYGAQ